MSNYSSKCKKIPKIVYLNKYKSQGNWDFSYVKVILYLLHSRVSVFRRIAVLYSTLNLKTRASKASVIKRTGYEILTLPEYLVRLNSDYCSQCSSFSVVFLFDLCKGFVLYPDYGFSIMILLCHCVVCLLFCNRSVALTKYHYRMQYVLDTTMRKQTQIT